MIVDTLAQDDAPVYQVLLEKVGLFRKYLLDKAAYTGRQTDRNSDSSIPPPPPQLYYGRYKNNHHTFWTK